VKVALLDLNVLIALLWPAHEHHDAAHRWFQARLPAPWATTPMTQLGFVRIVSNPAFSRDALSPAGAVALLAQNLTTSAHRFWPDDLQVPSAVRAMESSLQGHQQFTDAYLLAVAARHRANLATFDRGLRGFGPHASIVELVPVR
jgi:toxin-antitoxin system PIN domain toxin